MVRVLKKTIRAFTIAGKGLTNNETLPIKPRVSPCNDDFTVISYSPLYTQFYTITLKYFGGLVNIFYIPIPSVKNKKRIGNFLLSHNIHNHF